MSEYEQEAWQRGGSPPGESKQSHHGQLQGQGNWRAAEDLPDAGRPSGEGDLPQQADLRGQGGLPRQNVLTERDRSTAGDLVPGGGLLPGFGNWSGLGEVRKIAVLRPNALGDFIFCLPALHALRHRYPDARISFVGKEWHAQFLDGRPGPIDEVLVLPPYPGVGAPAVANPELSSRQEAVSGSGVSNIDGGAVGACTSLDVACAAQTSARTDNLSAAALAFSAEMRAKQFDLALQLYGGGRHANPLVRSWGARHSIGMKTADAAPLDRWINHGDVVNKRLQLLEVARLAGAQAWPMYEYWHVTEYDRQQALACLPAHAWQAPLVLLQPGSTDPRRCWPATHFAQLGDALSARGLRIGINGTAAEAPLVGSIMAAMRFPAIDLSGKASLHALCGLMERCALLVSNDTGPLHLALEIGTPAVGIYWLTNLIESAPLRQQGHRSAVSLQMHCSVCGAKNITTRCPHDPSFVDSVSVDEVLGHSLALLNERASVNEEDN